MRKGQSSTEYLVILAVIVLLALIVAGVTRIFPAMSWPGQKRASSAYWSSTDIAIVHHNIDPSGAENIFWLRNNLGSAVRLRQLTVGGTVVYATNTSMSPGEVLKLNASSLASQLQCASSGSPYSYPVEILYRDTETRSEHIITGEGHNLEGTCSS